MAIYGYKKFRNPTTERINLVNNNVVKLDTPVGTIIAQTVADGSLELVTTKPTEFDTSKRYFLLAEIPTENYFVGAKLENMEDIANLIERAPQGDWASQFINLRKDGIK